MGTFGAIAYLIPTIILEYNVVMLIFYYKYYKPAVKSVLARTGSDQIFNFDFHNTYTSIFGEKYNILLLVTRFITFGFFFSIALLLSFIEENPHAWNYFTLWNVMIISLYFLLASISSFLGCFYNVEIQASLDRAKLSHGVELDNWSKYVPLLSRAVHIVFEVAGATGLLITVVNFILLNPEFSFWNVSHHFLTSCVLLLEMCQVRLPVVMLHYPFNLTWVSIFTVFTWIIVSLDIRYWPYPFMVANDWTCVLWYSGLMVLNFLFYCLWYWISLLRNYCWGYAPNELDDLQTYLFSDAQNEYLLVDSEAGSAYDRVL